MIHRTTFDIEPSPRKITFETPVMLIGSCFANEIGEIMSQGKLSVFVNPCGTVYNPFSIGNTIDMIISCRELDEGDLTLHNGLYFSFLHHTGFASDNRTELLGRINSLTKQAHRFLSCSSFLFVTFGTSMIYRLKETGKVVSNCHKMPSEIFSQEMLSVKDITDYWKEILDSIRVFNRDISIIFTVSPVRHWKDGAHVNQVSKSVLFLAIEELTAHPSVLGYFPAYEIVMDDLRDYRYYAEDMLHPSETAVGYIWDAFSSSYLRKEDIETWKEIRKVTKAMDHRFLSDNPKAKKEFASVILQKIEHILIKQPALDFSREVAYFESIKRS